MIVERAIILAAALALLAIGVCAWRCLVRRRLAHLAETDAPQSVRDLITGEAPAILYFTTPECAQCRYQQAPILERLAQGMRVVVYTIDAVAQQEIANFYGIMTVPSTVVLNPHLQPVAVNHGLASSEQLSRQLAQREG